MAGNPAIHRRPSGDVDIALPADEPEASREAFDGAASLTAPAPPVSPSKPESPSEKPR
jgi:hypothetical protein